MCRRSIPARLLRPAASACRWCWPRSARWNCSIPAAARPWRGGRRFGVPIIVSSVTQPGLEAVAAAGDGPKIFQLYVRGDDALIDDLVQRAVDAGYDAFCITVDTALLQPARARHRQALRQAVARHRDRARASRPALTWDNIEALQGQAQDSADPERHRHRPRTPTRLRAGRGCASTSPTTADGSSITAAARWMCCPR